MSSASIAGVLPTAGMSVISGVVMRPSGRTWTLRRQLRIAPDEDVELVERADDIFLARLLPASPRRRRAAVRGRPPLPRSRRASSRLSASSENRDGAGTHGFTGLRSRPTPVRLSTGAGSSSAMRGAGEDSVRKLPNARRASISAAAGWPRNAVRAGRRAIGAREEDRDEIADVGDAAARRDRRAGRAACRAGRRRTPSRSAARRIALATATG